MWRDNTSVSLVLIFIPALSHAQKTNRVHVEGPVEKMLEVRAGLKGRGARDNFHWRAPMT